MIYTAIVGDLDNARSDIPVFSDYGHFKEPVLNAKIFKVLAHLFVPGQSIWVDGNIFPTATEQEIFSELPYDCDLGMFRHPMRSRASEEAEELIDLKVGHAPSIDDWKNHPGGWGFGLFEANVIVRRDSDRVRRFNECWWSLVCRWPWRDQLTVPEALRISGCRVHRFDWSNGHNRSHKFFTYKPHAK